MRRKKMEVKLKGGAMTERMSGFLGKCVIIEWHDLMTGEEESVGEDLPIELVDWTVNWIVWRWESTGQLVAIPTDHVVMVATRVDDA